MSKRHGNVDNVVLYCPVEDSTFSFFSFVAALPFIQRFLLRTSPLVSSARTHIRGRGFQLATRRRLLAWDFAR